MRWRSGRRSSNIEDRRTAGGGASPGPRRAAVPLGGGALLLIAVLAYMAGADPAQVIEVVNQAQSQAPVSAEAPGSTRAPGGAQDEMSDFVAVILGDTEDVWQTLFQEMGEYYAPPRLVLFTGAVDSACGYSTAAVGPFYCSGDRKVFLDLSFFAELERRHGAPGDFAQAYVIAHEIGHHVQAVRGVSAQVHAARRRVSEERANDLSVRLELQADCYAGTWAHHANRLRNLLEPGDLEEGLRAASAIGDDRLQRESRGYVTPESFTHGTSEQRVRWFRRGFETGDIETCDTFNADRL